MLYIYLFYRLLLLISNTYIREGLGHFILCYILWISYGRFYCPYDSYILIYYFTVGCASSNLFT